jgi:hypothetical protein
MNGNNFRNAYQAIENTTNTRIEAAIERMLPQQYMLNRLAENGADSSSYTPRESEMGSMRAGVGGSGMYASR